MMSIFKLILPIGRFFGLVPLVKAFTARHMKQSLTNAGFDIEYKWRPGKGQSIFMVARKSA